MIPDDPIPCRSGMALAQLRGDTWWWSCQFHGVHQYKDKKKWWRKLLWWLDR